MRLQADLRQAYTQRNEQLRAVIDIFRTHESKNRDINLDHIAERAARSLGLDVCTILEFNEMTQKFAGRGNYGLLNPEYVNVTLRSKFKELYMHKDAVTIIPDVRKDPMMRVSQFVHREGIRSTVVYPLRVDGQSIGLFFGNYRELTQPTDEDLKSIGLFADVAAHVLHRANLETNLKESQDKEERRRLLVWISMAHDMWQHNLVLKASSIRNYTLALQRRMNRMQSLPDAMQDVPETLTEIDRLAGDIANAPPRVPHDSEMNSELVPIASLLQEIAEREHRSLRLQGIPIHRIEVEVKALGGIQVRGYRRWLIYMFESLIQNAYRAMPRGGVITIKGTRQRQWAEIRVTDTGRGVPKRLRDKIFKFAVTGRRNPAGLGIGSLLAKTIIEENRGNIELEKPGPGDTTVLIKLPIEGRVRKA
jgi:K+-sensing histidine kinase KdpD